MLRELVNPNWSQHGKAREVSTSDHVAGMRITKAGFGNPGYGMTLNQSDLAHRSTRGASSLLPSSLVRLCYGQ